MNVSALSAILGIGLSAASLCIQAAGAQADSGWRGHSDIAMHLQATGTHLQDASVLNPGNVLAQLSKHSQSAEARFDLRLQSDALRLTLRPILRQQWPHQIHQDPVQLSQGQLHWASSDTLSLSFGREIMHWGPAQFRSPASPFYFDNGRADPASELTGVDRIKLAWTPAADSNISLAWVRNGSEDLEGWRNSVLLKAERRGDDWTGGLVLAQAESLDRFVAAYAQWTSNQDWLWYGEAASGARAKALISPADTALPFRIAAQSAERGTFLLGAMRSFENGHSLSLEYLHDGHGYTRDEAAAYFHRAAGSMADAGLALRHAPALLGRNYLHLLWQNNLLENSDYWRLMWSRNLDDDSQQLALWLEHPIDSRLSLYGLGLHTEGGPRREFSGLINNRLQIGLRLALP